MQTPKHLRAELGPNFTIDPELPQRQLRHFATEAQSTGRRAMIETLRRHLYEEMIGLDLDRLMATFAPAPTLHWYGMGAPLSAIGEADVRAHYARGMPARKMRGLTTDIERLIVDDEAIVFDMVSYFSPVFAESSFGWKLPPSDAPAVVAKRICVVVPFDGVKMRSELQYYDGPVTPADLLQLG